jgi:2-polyprenyl-6-methoxyphenol hydroxylase-like FAD-dependent oxidoreductase
MKVAIVGAGIGGLCLALALHQRGIACEVFEGVAEIREIGVGITLLPHAMRELSDLGLQQQLEQVAIENLESVFFNRFGQFIYREPRGRHAGYELPELGIHRGRLHRVLYEAAVQRLGAGAVHTGHRCVRVEQSAHEARVHFAPDAHGQVPPSASADMVIGCDGVNSAVRQQFYPNEGLAFGGINTWRGVSRFRPILSGKSFIRIGSVDTGKMVIYPIVDDVDGQGLQRINWVAEIRDPEMRMNDWNRPGRMEDVLAVFGGWNFDWLDVRALIESAETIFEYPMVDRDPVAQWSFGRVSLLGDAAHPMYPRGSNGSAQAMRDARALADLIAADPQGDPLALLAAYEAQRLPVVNKVVLTNRATPPDYIIMKADELSGGRPFGHIDELISQEELRAIASRYEQVAGFAKPQTSR